MPCTHAASLAEQSRQTSLDQLCLMLLAGQQLIQPAKASLTAPDYALGQTLGTAAVGALPAATSTGAAVMPALPAALAPATLQLPVAGRASSATARVMATPATAEDEVEGGSSCTGLNTSWSAQLPAPAQPGGSCTASA